MDLNPGAKHINDGTLERNRREAFTRGGGSCRQAVPEKSGELRGHHVAQTYYVTKAMMNGHSL
jgi:hypothetical protein